MDYTMTVNNKYIHSFFQNNPGIDFEASILLLIQMIELSSKHVENNSMHTKIMSMLKDQQQELRNVKKDISNMRNDIYKRIDEIRNDYITEVKTLLKTNNHEHFVPLLEKTYDQCVDKINILLNEIVPKNNANMQTYMKSLLVNTKNDLMEYTNKLCSGRMTEESIGEYIMTLDTKISNMFQTMQQPMYSYILSSEERMLKQMQGLRDYNTENDKVMKNLDEFLNTSMKYKNSNARGKMGENRLGEVLNQCYPNAYIQDTSMEPESGDFILKHRLGSPAILFENKDYTHNVNTEEVVKFVRDITVQRIHGIFVSQSSGIVGKKPYQIEIHNGMIAVYIMNCGYEPEKIKIAVDIIDSLASTLGLFYKDTSDECGLQIKITENMLHNLNEEYSTFVAERQRVIENVKTLTKDLTRTLITQIETIKMPVLSGFLSAKYGVSLPETQKFVCEICESFVGRSAASLAAHKKGCRRKRENTNTILATTSAASETPTMKINTN